jgi:hypothetical protein
MIRKKTIQLLQKILGLLVRKYNNGEYVARKAHVRQFLHEILPEISEQFRSSLMIEDGIYNYFVLDSTKSLPKFDFVLPEHNIYVIVGDIRSASWEEARSRGVSRQDWENYHSDLLQINRILPNMVSSGDPKPIFVHIIRWTDSISSEYLYSLFIKEHLPKTELNEV